MKKLAYASLALLVAGSVVASSNFVSNPQLPYPPGCARMPTAELLDVPDTGTVKIFDQSIDVYSSQVGERVPVRVEVYRSHCSEVDRSLIWLSFRLAGSHAGRGIDFELPWVSAEPPSQNGGSLMSLVVSPNGWGENKWFDRQESYLVADPFHLEEDYFSVTGERRWLFLLDNGPQVNVDFFGQHGITASQYNAAFKLTLGFPADDQLEVLIPATSAILSAPAPPLPISGRQSGLWVVEGAADQGIHLAVSEQVGEQPGFMTGVPDLPLVIFFSQYTYDVDGNLLWLTGATQFEPGTTEVTVPVELVTNGEFRGSKPAERKIIGQVTLTSNSCNDVGFEYDYSSLGLGSGVQRLQRLFSLETAGYDCRDYAARVAANQ